MDDRLTKRRMWPPVVDGGRQCEGRSRPSSTIGTAGRPLDPRFWLVWAATLISGLGDGLLVVAVPLLALRFTRDPRLVALAAAAPRLPWLLLSLPAGAAADRFDRRRLLILADVARCGVVALAGTFLALDLLDFSSLCVVALILGALEVVHASVAPAVLPGLVGPNELPRANGLLYAAQTTGEQFIGPAVGGAVVVASAAMPFFADAATFAAAALLIAAGLPRSMARGVASAQSTGVAANRIGDGARHVWRVPALRLVTATVALLALCQGAVLATLVLFVTGPLHLGASTFGLFVAGTAIGNVVGGLSAGKVSARVRTGPLVVGAGLVAAAAYVVAGLFPAALVAVVALAVEAVAVALGNVATLTLRQRLVPDDLLGRVGAATRCVVFGAMPAGALVGGLVANLFGPRGPLLAAGLVQAVAILLIARPLVRAVDRASRLRPGSVATAERTAPAFSG